MSEDTELEAMTKSRDHWKGQTKRMGMKWATANRELTDLKKKVDQCLMIFNVN